MRILIAMAFAISTAAAQQPAKWRLVEEWRVGGDVDGAHSFADTRGMALFPDGRIAIVDYKDAQVHILDAKGEKVRTIGRKGAGPGEFDRPNGLVVSPQGQIIVNDPVSNNRLTILASNGDFIKTVLIMNRWGYSYTWDAYFNAAGRLEEPVSVRRTGETSSISTRRAWSTDFASMDTIMPATCPSTGPAPNPDSYMYQFRGKTGSMMMGIPFLAPSHGYVRTTDGATWAASSPGYAKITHTPSGKCDADVSIVLQGKRVAIPSAIRDSMVAVVKANAARYSAPDPDVGKIPTEYTPFDALYVDQAKRLWVQRRIDAKKYRFEVYDSAGKQLADVETPALPSAARPVVITADKFLCFVADEDGLMHLVSFRIVR